MKNIYLFLSILGGLVPYLFFFGFIQESGFDIPLFVSSVFVNGASGGFGADLLISSLVFWLFMYEQRHSRNAPSLFGFVVLNLTIGLSCALPAYLYAVEKRKSAIDGSGSKTAAA